MCQVRGRGSCGNLEENCLHQLQRVTVQFTNCRLMSVTHIPEICAEKPYHKTGTKIEHKLVLQKKPASHCMSDASETGTRFWHRFLLSVSWALRLVSASCLSCYDHVPTTLCRDFQKTNPSYSMYQSCFLISLHAVCPSL